jgi:hypothetical protein
VDPHRPNRNRNQSNRARTTAVLVGAAAKNPVLADFSTNAPRKT